MDIDTLITIVLAVAGIGWILIRRMLGRVVDVKSLFVLPGVLCVVGASQLQGIGPLTAPGVALLAAGVAISVVVGLARGATVGLGVRDGLTWMRYRVLTVLLWLVNIGAKIAMIPLERMIAPGSDAAGQAVLVSLGVGVLAESAVVLLRARRRGAVPWRAGPGRSDVPDSRSIGGVRAGSGAVHPDR